MMLFNQSDEINTKATNVEEALPYRFRGLAGRFTYSFDDRYFGEFNFGYNGSENFAPKNRYGFFPSVGLGWVISNEPFFRGATEVIQYLKLRGTWGRVGNSQISGRRFAYLATVKDTNDTSYQFGKNMDQTYGTTAIDEYAVDVTWEIADKTNIGLDMRLLNNKFNLQFDAFKESRKGIYLRRTSIPSYFGMINNPYGNIGKVENKGIEMSVSYANSWRDWSLSVMGNYSFNRNKVLEDDSTVAYPWQKPSATRSTSGSGSSHWDSSKVRRRSPQRLYRSATRARATSATRTSTATAKSTNMTKCPSAGEVSPKSSTASDSP